MAKKSKQAVVDKGNDNWVPGWFGGISSPAAQKSAKNWEKERMKARILAFEAARRSETAEYAPPASPSV